MESLWLALLPMDRLSKDIRMACGLLHDYALNMWDFVDKQFLYPILASNETIFSYFPSLCNFIFQVMGCSHPKSQVKQKKLDAASWSQTQKLLMDAGQLNRFNFRRWEALFNPKISQTAGPRRRGPGLAG